ncbi:hypothetical protein YDYSY3_60570 [Paenibacillus chitinolyticus]|nr:hypothetical protein YDYSY3_60570 [Paenibacillus chitinolyticus]
MQLNNDTARLIRANTQMNQVQLAKIVGISRALLAKIETNAKPNSNSVERRIRTAFGLDDEKISQLLNNALYSVPGRN